MYGHINNSVYDHSSGLFSQYYPSTFAPPLPQSLTSELDSAAHEAVMLGNRNGNGTSSTGSGCTSSSYISSPSSPMSCCTSNHPPNSTTVIQRSLSSHSLHINGLYPHVLSPPGLSDLDLNPVRRVFSTGDLDKGINTLCRQHQQRGGSPLANESASIILEGMTKACRYSPEEKRERIERYRSKRNQRNFNKKIQYACRKTLADSRPRIRGRFARNDEIEKMNYSPDLQWNQIAVEDEEEDDEHWIHLLNSISPNIVP